MILQIYNKNMIFHNDQYKLFMMIYNSLFFRLIYIYI